MKKVPFLFLIATIAVAFTGNVHAQAPVITQQPNSFSLIFTFTNTVNIGGSNPGGLIKGTDGRLYGVATFGGANGDGTVFAVNADGSGYTPIYNFTGVNEGGEPQGSLIQGTDGRLYGMTVGAGTSGIGAIFVLNTNGAGFTVVHAFTGGATPTGTLIQGSDGRLYGATQGGGTYGYGTVFGVNIDGSNFATLYSFTGGTDGANPYAGLIQGTDGRLYGTAAGAGAYGLGTVFALEPNGTDFATLYVFTGGTDGGVPYAGLVQGNDGRLYGTATGLSVGEGTVFAVKTDGSSFATLYTFTGGLDGGLPGAPLIQGTDGRLYGTASVGGVNGSGTMFATKTDGTGFAVLYSFAAGNALSFPGSGLIQGVNGQLYGTTNVGGANSTGTIFAVNTDGTDFSPLYSFNIGGGNNGSGVWDGLFQGSDGRLYGTSYLGGTFSRGNVFAMNPDGTGFATLHNFTGGTDGGSPLLMSLIQGTDGRLYGTSYVGGAPGPGTVFAVKSDGTGFAVLYNFSYSNSGGGLPIGAVLQGTDGRLYGTAEYGGANGAGTAYAMHPDGTGFTPIHAFSGGNDGGNPNAGLIQGADGRLYGTTASGGAGGGGTAFAMKSDGTDFATLHAFTGGADGAYIQDGLIQGSDGRLYGTTQGGGTNGNGTVFAVSADGTNFTVVHSFTGSSDGANPNASLIQGADGRLYGSTGYGGIGNNGSLFSVNTDGSGYVVLYNFNGSTDGAEPTAALVQGTDGRLYGMASGGGLDGNGTVYSIAGPPLASGSSVTYTVAAAGAGPLSYQWQLNGANISGAIGSSLTLSNLSSSNNGSYTVVVSNSAGSVTSSAVTLVVVGPPVITTQPADQTTFLGGTVTFSAAATGYPAPTYQWQFNGVNIPGATGATLMVSGVTPDETGQYDVVVSNSSGSITSSVAALFINDPLSSDTDWLEGVYSKQASPSTFPTFQNGRLELINSPPQNQFTQIFPSPGENGALMVSGITPALMGSMTADWSVQVDVHGAAVPVSPSVGYYMEFVLFNLQAGQNYSTGAIFGLSYNDDNQNGVPPLNRVDTGFWNLWNTPNADSSIPNSATDFTFRTAYTSSTHQLATSYSTDGGVTWTTTYSFDVTQPNVNAGGGWGMTVVSGTSFGIGFNIGASAALASGDVYLSNFTYSGLTAGQWITTSTVITTQPSSQATVSGGTAVLSVAAIGFQDDLKYQWYLNGTALTDGGNISGSQTATITLTNVDAADAGSYTVVVSDPSAAIFVGPQAAPATSVPVTLTVLPLPTITAQPSNQTVLLGGTATFSVGTTDVGGTYQWQFDGVDIPGATNATLTITGVAPENTGQYDVVLTNGNGSTTSSVATLYINDPLSSVNNWVGADSDSVFENGRLDVISNQAQGGGFQLMPMPGGNGAPMVDGITRVLMGTMTADWSAQVDMHCNAIPVGPTQSYQLNLMLFDMQPGQFYTGGQVGFQYNNLGQNGVPPLGNVVGAMWELYNVYSNIPTTATDFTFRAFYSSSTHQLSTSYSTDGGATWTALTSFDVTQPLVNNSGGWGMAITSGPSFGITLCFQPSLLVNPGDIYMSNFVYSGLTLGTWTPTQAAIATQPTPQVTVSGGTTAFSVAAVGTPGDILQYQWYLNGVALTDSLTVSGSQTATLTLSDVGAAEAGSYTVVVSENDTLYGQGLSSATSAPVALTVALPQITSLNPTSVISEVTDLPQTLMVYGSNFNSGDTVLWTDGTHLETTFVSGTELNAIVPGADLEISGDITTELISVQSASDDTSNLEVLSVVSAAVTQVQASVAPPGGSATDSTAPTIPGNGGVTATLQNTSTSAPSAAISVANYSTNPTPVAPTIDVGGQYVDLQVTSVTAADTVTAYFYYPSTITGANADNLQLLYFDGTTWGPVLSSGGTVPVKNETPDLNGTVSGGQFTVVFDNTSTPTITNLSGTVFTPSIVTIPPVIQSVTPSPAYLTPANNQMVPVTIAVVATDQFYPNLVSQILSVTSNEPSTNGTVEWQITGPLTLNLLASRSNTGTGRIYTITIQTTDSAGNKATQQTEVIVPKDKDALSDAPAIVTQPQSQTVNAGANVTFSVATTAALPVTYQWLFNGAIIAGATGTTLSLSDVTLANAGSYTVAATNSIGTTTSHKAKLTVNAGPAFTTQPQSVTADVGAKVVFTAVATGGPKPHYQWFLNGVTLSGGKSGTLTINKVKASDAGTYTVTATNSFGSATSNPAVLMVNAPPTIKTQPKSETVKAGATATFTVVATGTPTLTYQWAFNGTAIPGAMASTLTLTDVGAAAAGSYSVTVTNSIGSITSNAATLKVR